MSNAFHDWVTKRTNCEVFDVHCETDKDCDMGCKTTLYSGELTRFVCNDQTTRCNRVVYNSYSYEQAAKDLANILGRINSDGVYASLIPPDFMWFLKHNNGRLFVSKRAAFYDLVSLGLGQLNNVDTLVEIMERRTAKALRERLFRQLDLVEVNDSSQYRKAEKWILEVTAEDKEEEEEGAVDVSFEHFLRNVLGDSTISELSGLEADPSPVVLKKVSPSKMRQALTNEGPEYLCNEGMNAGRAEAVFQDRTTGERLAVCSCTYPEYLSGPTCQQRMYRYVIDYDKWAKTNWPEFLTDPVKHFIKADNVCRGLGRNAVAEYSTTGRAFVCVTVADLTKSALTFRGPYEPSLIMERDINKAENAASESFGVNWEYVNFLGRLQRRL